MHKRVLLIGILVALTFLLVPPAVPDVAAANATRLLLFARLSGANEIGPGGEPGVGDPNGVGLAYIFLDSIRGQVCWRLTYRNIAAPSAAHIHTGPAGQNGSIVVTLSPIPRGCTTVDKALVGTIIQSPRQYYVNIHNAEYADGAMRGQLHKPPRISALSARLSGANEVGGGDPDGRGSAFVFLDPAYRLVCWRVVSSNIATPTAAHIHSGLVGYDGPIVVTLSPIRFGCVVAGQDQIDAIQQDPALYYVNVHNADYQDGAIRGQLGNLN